MRIIFAAVILGVFGIACSNTTAPTETAGSSTPVPLATPNPAVVDDEVAVIETAYGKIKIKFFPDVAPRHVRSFKELTRQKFYDGLAFHRVIPNGLIQGGDPTTRDGSPEEWGKGLPGQPKVPAEFSTRPFVIGAVGMARKGGDVDSATSQFFITLEDHPRWNGQYTVFGEVIEGLETARSISKVESVGGSQRVKEKVIIERVYLEKIKN